MEEKDKRVVILDFLKRNGPAIPVQIARETELNTIFTGAFLSELSKEKEIMLSNMRVGNSPVYFLPGQELLLERFQIYIKGKEKEALVLLKTKKVLKDSKQDPAIRVALRSLKDFALPFKIEDNLFWRYFNITNKFEIEEILGKESAPILINRPRLIQKQAPPPIQINKPKLLPKLIEKITPEQLKEAAEEEIEREIIQEEGREEEEEGREEEAPFIKTPSPKIKPKKIDPKEKFLQEIKAYLISKQVEIINIEKKDKKQIIGLVKVNNQEHLMVAFNKKRFNEADLVKIHRKYAQNETPFYFLCKENLSKKTQEMIRACKRLKGVGLFG